MTVFYRTGGQGGYGYGSATVNTLHNEVEKWASVLPSKGHDPVDMFPAKLPILMIQ